MKKSTKLLSVLLAVVMLFSSLSVLASAARTSYQTTSDLETLEAYSPYGAVTRLSTEERLSILFDYLDLVLNEANINPGTLFNTMGLSLTVDLRSVDAILGTLDSVKALRSNGLVSLVSGLLGIIADLDVSTWSSGMTRDNTAQFTIVYELVEFLNANRGVVGQVIRDGEVDLGLASSAISGLDLSIIKDIPGLIKGLIFPLMERKDDTVAEAEALVSNATGNGKVESTLVSFVQSLFTKPQSTTTVKADSTGALTSDHVLPTAADGLRYYYVAGTTNGLPSYTCYVYNTDTDGYDVEEGAFILTEEVEGSGVYVFQKTTGETLKYYEPGSYWLPSLTASGNAASIMNISTRTGVQMLYDMIPYVFSEMAPVVLNGSVKKLVAEWFGAQFNYVGEVGSAEVSALGSDAIFTGEQGDYLWEWSDYAVINGAHYYRFEDSVYQADLTNCNAYMNIINWDYEISGDMLNKYIPGADGTTASAAGYTTILQALNDFLGEVVGLIFSSDVVSGIGWTNGDNSNLLENVKKAARYVVQVAPETIFGASYAEDEYYNLLISTSSTDQEILCGIAAKLLEFLMPQLILPSAENLKGQSLGAMFAMVIRELATQLLPTYNYDALIYTDYNTKTLLSGKDNNYWLDVCLTMGVDIGMNYLRNLVDLGEDTDVGYKFEASKVYTLDAFQANTRAWEDTVDWVIDWALCDDYEWTWKMEKFVDCGDTIDLATAQDPWVKLGNILSSLLPVDQILNVDTSDSHWLETALRDNFVMALLDLNVGKIVGDASTTGLLDIPNDSVLFTTNLLSALTVEVRDLLNGLLYKVAGNANLLDPNTFTSIDTLFNQSNLATLIENLLNKLYVAVGTNGLLDPVMPILGFFVGWITDTQKFADPDFQLTDTANGGEYLYAQNGAVDGTLRIRNDATGMLLKHSDGTYDSPYALYVTNITCSDSNLTAYLNDGTSAFAQQLIAPWASYSFRLRGSYTADEAVTITVTYYFMGKDGKALGGQQNLTLYAFVTNQTTDIYAPYSDSYKQSGLIYALDVAAAATTNAFVPREEDFGSVVGGLSIIYTNKRDDEANTTAGGTTPGSEYIVSSNQAEDYVGTDLAKEDSRTVNPFKANPDADLSTLASGSSIAIGSTTMTFYDKYLSKTATKTFTCDFGTLYYADMGELIDLYEAEVAAKRAESDYAATEWAAYRTAMLNAVAFIYNPAKVGDFATRYAADNIASYVTALQDAITALEDARVTTSSADAIKTALETAEGENGINFQNYRFFEYWDYEEIRNEAWDILAAYETPEAPDKYIEGNSLSEAEINAIAGAETNTTLKSAIESTMLDPSKADLEAYQAAVAAYTAPTYAPLYLADVESKISYYANFLTPVAVTTEKQFLIKELSYAAAQNYVAAEYSTDSWAAYQAALATANEVNGYSSALQSTVFDAKYQLMLTQNQLVKVEDSAKDTGVYDNLKALIATADSIFADTEGAWTVKEGVEPADAYKQLVEALGYEYVDEDGYTQNLYTSSAKAFVATDRMVGDSTTAATNAMTDTLQAAIDNFVSAAQPELQLSNNGSSTGAIIDRTSYCANGAGFIYGIDAYSDADILDKLATPAGSIRVTANDYGVYSTGAKIELLNATGDVVETYYYIFFGDVNGDSFVDFTDVTTVEGINSFLDFDFAAGDGSIAGMAADVNGDGFIDFTDVTYIEGVNSFLDFPTQAETAATVAANKGIS